MNKVLSIDIGGSKILFGIVDELGNASSTFSVTLNKDITKENIISIIKENTKELLKEELIGVGITIPGLADSKNGIWVLSPFNGIKDFNIVKELNEFIKIPIKIENDVNACAIGELVFNKETPQNYLWMTVSNGIGGAIVINKELFLGDFGNAGEFGHIIVDRHDPFLCGCGNKGCLEAMASGNGISNLYNRYTSINLKAKEISELAKKGDENALKAFEMSGYYIGKALASIVNTLNITTIYLGGGVMNSYDLVIDSIYKSIDKFVFKKANPEIKVLKTKLGYNAALLGAAALVLK